MSNSLPFKIIIQARMGSTRLARKMNLPFHNGKTILEIIIEKLKTIAKNHQIILATGINSENDILEEKALLQKIQVYRGDEKNVLKRFINAAEKHETENIIRICADNPFLQIDWVAKLAKSFTTKNCDYMSWYVNNSRPSIKTHNGFFAEAVSLSALKKVKASTSEAFYLEHVTNYIYENVDKFNIEWLPIDDKILNDIRLTIDNSSDFKIAKDLYKNLYPNSDYESIKKYLLENKSLLLEMGKNIKDNEK